MKLDIKNFDLWLLDNEKISQDERELIIEAIYEYSSELKGDERYGK